MLKNKKEIDNAQKQCYLYYRFSAKLMGKQKRRNRIKEVKGRY